MGEPNSDNGEYVCEVCDAAFESADARAKHLHDMGLLN